MKKFLAVQIAVILISCIATKAAIPQIGDAGLIRINTTAQELSDTDAFTIRAMGSRFSEIELTLDRYLEHQNWVRDRFGSEIVVITATAAGRIDTFNNMYIEYVDVLEVTQGDPSLAGNSLEIYCEWGGFYLRDVVNFKRYLERLESQGYTRENNPEAFEWRAQYTSNLNFLKDGDKYLIILHKITLEGIHYYFYAPIFSHFNLDSDYSVPVQNGNYDRYYKYSENEFFGQTQEIVDDFYEFKREILEYYLGEDYR
ncbi:MAG: hypothetical protein FWG90_09550 [Oscillospiraceae bacterium]|nr:hypothetical protein [Oscillospiraceae bacterium]